MVSSGDYTLGKSFAQNKWESFLEFKMLFYFFMIILG